MNLQSISKEKREVVASLSADDLVVICNALSVQIKEKKCGEKCLRLYSDMILARNLCQYGHVDDFCLRNMAKCRNSIGDGLDGILSDADIDVFNAYLEDNDMPTAFENSDWKKIYKKIVGKHGYLRSSEKVRQWMDQSKD